MEAQTAQQATGISYARPQQPTDSPVAALPTETLQQIFELALDEEEDAFKRQSTRRSFGAVCYHWCSVMPPATEYAVKSAKEAKKLALKLKQTGRGGKVQLVAIRLNAVSSVDRSGRTAMLLDACRNVEHLSIDLETWLANVPSEYERWGGFGLNLLEAMKKLRGLHFVELYDKATVTPPVLAEMIAAWPDLHTLRLNSHFERDYSARSLPVAAALRHLDIVADYDLVQALLPHLTPVKTPLSLVVRKRLGDESLPGADVACALLPLAERLDCFAAPDGWATHREVRYFISSAKKLHTLMVHASSVEGLPLLDRLAELRKLVIEGAALSQINFEAILRMPLPPALATMYIPTRLA